MSSIRGDEAGTARQDLRRVSESEPIELTARIHYQTTAQLSRLDALSSPICLAAPRHPSGGGLLVAPDPASRAARLGTVEARLPDPLGIDDRVAREWGWPNAATSERGGNPRRAADLAIAATANVHRATLLTHNSKGFAIIA